MKKKLLAVLFTVVMTLTVGLFATACKKDPPPAETYNVTFDFNYTGAPDSVVVPVEKGKTVDEPSKPTRSGYTFGGWLDENGDTFAFSTPITGDITLKASWTAQQPAGPTTYNLTFAETLGVTYLFNGTQPSSAEKNAVIQFSIKVSPYYVVNDAVVVKANGTALTASNGVYSFTVLDATTITVEGVEADDTEMGGQGTLTNPFKIGTPAQWLGFVSYVTEANGDVSDEYFELIDDIDFEEASVPVIEWLFGAIFDGNGHKLSNATINTSVALQNTKTLSAFVARAALCEFYNIEIENIAVSVSASTNNVTAAALVAYAMQVTVENVHVTGDSSITASASNVAMVAGIVGELYAITGPGANFASVTYCTSSADVTASGSSAYAAGIVGAIGGDNTDMFTDEDNYCYAFVAYCAATGRLTSEFAVGGIAAFVQPYAAIQNCYFAGTQASERVYGGIAAVIFEEELVIANCFSTATYTPDDFSHYVYGRAIEQASLAREYEADTYIADCYYAPNGVFTVGANTYNFADNAADILALLKWNQNSWDLDGALPVPQLYDAYEATLGVTAQKAYEVAGEEGGTVTVPADVKQTKSVHFADPIAFIGTFITNSFDALLIPSTESSGSWLSSGYYLNDMRLPGAYLITDNTDTQDIELRFVNYAEVAGEYYFVSYSNGTGYKLVLYNNGMATVIGSNNETARFVYAYFGSEEFNMGGDTVNLDVIAFVGAPSYVFATDLNPTEQDGNELLPRVYLNQTEGRMFSLYRDTDSVYFFEGFSYSDVVGAWYNGTTDGYKFDVNRTGTYTDGTTTKAFTWAYADADKTGVTVTFKDGTPSVTLSFNDGKNKFLDNTTEYAKKANAYGGTYVTDVYTGATLTVTGDEVLDGNGKFTVGATTYKVNTNGFIVTDDEETTYYAENSFAGIWYGTSEVDNEEYKLILGGINIYGVGEATFFVFDWTYAVTEATDTTVTLTLYWSLNPSTTATVTIDLATTEMTFNCPALDSLIGTIDLKLDDVFRGDWYAQDGTKYTFADQSLAIDDGAPAAYTYVNSTTITVGGNTITYSATTASETLTLGSTTLYRSDLFGAYYFMDSDGNRWDFDGLGITGDGLLKITKRNSIEAYSYAIDPATGDAIVTDSDENTLFTASYANTGIVTITPYDGEGNPQTADAYTLGIYNSVSVAWTGTWTVASQGLPYVHIGVMDLQGNFEASAEGTYAAIKYGKVIGSRLRFYDASDAAVYETGVTSDGTYLMMPAGTTSGYPMYKMDAYMGQWTNAQIGSLELDGWGNSGVYLGEGAFTYMNGSTPAQFTNLRYAYDDAKEGMYLYYVYNGSLYYWYELMIMSVNGYDSAGYPYAAYANMYQTLEGVDENEGYALILIPYNQSADMLTGETLVVGTQELIFNGNDIVNDVLFGTPGNFVVLYVPDTSDASTFEACVYEITDVQDGDTPAEVIVVLELYVIDMDTDEVAEEPSYTVELKLNQQTGAWTLLSIEAYEAPAPEALAA